MRRFGISVWAVVSASILLTCDRPVTTRSDSSMLEVTSQACADCRGVYGAVIEWFARQEGLSTQDVVLDLANSGRATPQRPQVIDPRELSEIADDLGVRRGSEGEVLDCDDARLLANRPRCEMKTGEVLVRLSAPDVHGSHVIVRLQRRGPGPGGEWWLARYEIELARGQAGWDVVDHRLLNQS